MREMRENALPILEQAGVDLVLGGHSHNYERSYLLAGHYGSSETLVPAMFKSAGNGRPDDEGPYVKDAGMGAAHSGTVYVVAGSSGKIGRMRPAAHPAMCVSLRIAGSLVLDIEGPRLDATFIDNGGQVRDRFAILKPHARGS
jgi:hypothetical protein